MWAFSFVSFFFHHLKENPMRTHRMRFGSISIFMAPVLLLVLSLTAFAQTGPVSYTVTLDKQPTSHMVHISLTVNSGEAASVDVAMPSWSPGAYTIHNAWRNVQEFSASDDLGASLKFEKVDKQTWRINRSLCKLKLNRISHF